MTLTTRANEQIVFLPFYLDLAGGRLRRGSEAVGLPPKAFSVLQYLAERPGRLICKKELLDAIWPDVHVSEEVLKVAIACVRKALADPFREPRFIETAHRRGYRFIAKTDEPSGLESNAIPVTASAVPQPVIPPQPLIPITRYARSGDVNIAYQVLGNGPVDLVFVMGWVSHLEYFWTEPGFARFLRRLASFSRLILFDKRGTGLSDRVPLDALPTLEQRMDDVRAVMDAAGSNRAALCGVSEGGAMAALFAATYPERTAALVMIGTYAKRLRDENYPWAPTVAEREHFLEEIRDHWGEPVGLAERAPSMVSDAHFREWWATYLRMSASPGAAVALTRMNSEADIRNVLPAVRVPTLVIHRTGDRCLNVAEGRYVANRIPGARFVELPGADHLPFVGDQDSILDEVQDFVTGSRNVRRIHPTLATVLVATFRESGTRGTGNNAWPRFEDYVRKELDWFRRRESLQNGRDLLASFDGPARAIHCACSISEHASRMGIEMTAGLHVGECRTGIDGIRGSAVEMARAIEQYAGRGEILVSGSVRDLVTGSGICFQRKGVLRVSVSEMLSLLTVERSLAQRIGA